MERNAWKILSLGLTAALWLALAVAAWCYPPAERSLTERRPLAQMPTLSGETLSDRSFMADFESYAQDQFPLREVFRKLKAWANLSLFGRRDNNGIYVHQGQAAKLEYPLNQDSLNHALTVFQRIYDRYLTESQVYFAVIPDKGYYLTQENGYPHLDISALVETMTRGMPYADYVNLLDTLNGNSYYTTDLHWRQEALANTARRLCQALQIPEAEELKAVPSDTPFYGVYQGQGALSLPPDTLYTLQSPLLNQCKAYNYETGKYTDLYDAQKLAGEDPYQGFLSGSVSLIRIDNPNAQTQRELILFRDSFASPLAPLLIQGYRTITLVDVRYMDSQLLGRFLDFTGKDVLFLYSTTVLNNSAALK